ncbi:monooxygenase flavin-binding family protein-like protein [Mollisia scopiformis]|uniref:Monooxygenase flavin-binding family protein-like protein n=1 Tax=Mollisia scopiformis TaxID=149040 RepID=A0A194XFH6_MOLSC|nr:monooxygenase flavin-binding family protein-like protein [Mollisia scopiformis]KUJ18945.1 monooxygenase flavin-binding family protein-like protein [Mollisia scopiformis]
MGSIERPSVDFDVIIIGAGISGINAGYRVQTELPGYTYTILEARDAIGGTWDLFRYPGIRSDSDLHTFGFPWRPWSKPKAIADGTSIRNYIKESAEINGIDRKILFHHKLLAADWSSQDQQWSLSVDNHGERKKFRGRFIIMSTGYYDYNKPLKTVIPGLDNFQGTIIHPQFWPEDLDYAGKRMVIIGSGATAITLLPNLAEKAAHVTMLQRSPTYILALPAVDPSGDWMRRWLPAWMAHTLVRWKFLILPFIFFKFCRGFPNAARRIIRRNTEKQLPKDMPHDPNFNPSYGPWEQRLCVCPDGDFFKALQKGNADVVTDTIRTVTETSIKTNSGKTINTDIIVTATGLRIQLAGGARVSLDGKAVNFSEKYMWKGTMLQDLPNAAVVLGYTNASWTLGADSTARLVCRLLKQMDRDGQTSVVPTLESSKGMKDCSVLNLNSTYIDKAKGELPKASNVGPWQPRSNYFADYWASVYGGLSSGLQYTKALKKVN